MSHIINQQINEFRIERNQGAYSIEIPEGTLYTDTYIKKVAEEKEKKELREWDETINSDIF